MKIGNVAVDNFYIEADVYILTHCHADHMSGLKKWHENSLYCSELSAKILAKRGLGAISKPTNQPFELVDRRSSKTLKLTFIDANHCPGAVMVVIEDPEHGNYVHTGDFRMCDAIRHNNKLCRLAGKVQHLYLDATFNASWLPCKEDSVDMLKGLIRQHHDRDIILNSSCMGDEEMFTAISQFTDRKIIWWNQNRRKLLQCTHPGLLRHMDQYMTTGACIHIVKSIADCKMSGIKIVCSTLWFKNEGFAAFDMSQPFYDNEHGTWRVPFSMHSSAEEQQELEQLLHPALTTRLYGTDAQDKAKVVTEVATEVVTEVVTEVAHTDRDKEFMMRVAEAVDKSVEFYTAVDASSEEETEDLLELALQTRKRRRTNGALA